MGSCIQGISCGRNSVLPNLRFQNPSFFYCTWLSVLQDYIPLFTTQKLKWTKGQGLMKLLSKQHHKKHYSFLFVCLNIIYLFILAALGLHCCMQAFCICSEQGAILRCGAWASRCGGFSCCGAQVLGMRASVVVALRLSSCGSWSLEHRLSSCGAWA